jgi:hypothetical protein
LHKFVWYTVINSRDIHDTILQIVNKILDHRFQNISTKDYRTYGENGVDNFIFSNICL